MRRLVRTTVAVAAVAGGLTLALPATPASAEGKCVDVVLYTTPPTVITVCTPDI